MLWLQGLQGKRWFNQSICECKVLKHLSNSKIIALINVVNYSFWNSRSQSTRGQNSLECLQVPLTKAVVIRKLIVPSFLCSVCPWSYVDIKCIFRENIIAVICAVILPALPQDIFKLSFQDLWTGQLVSRKFVVKLELCCWKKNKTVFLPTVHNCKEMDMSILITA